MGLYNKTIQTIYWTEVNPGTKLNLIIHDLQNPTIKKHNKSEYYEYLITPTETNEAIQLQKGKQYKINFPVMSFTRGLERALDYFDVCESSSEVVVCLVRVSRKLIKFTSLSIN